ncbi:hypothetical protein WN51_14072 [Melipona quadrifasciata]|uniref:Uncharacterized protein n=1 Tax=Melipona quadrifasciata TaxID=166423 RepID=A0A0N0BFX8_9HYME|nr:hypothetical protein WN51_14072 [Melipona quadrifasciata]
MARESGDLQNEKPLDVRSVLVSHMVTVATSRSVKARPNEAEFVHACCQPMRRVSMRLNGDEPSGTRRWEELRENQTAVFSLLRGCCAFLSIFHSGGYMYRVSEELEAELLRQPLYQKIENLRAQQLN